MRVTRTPFGIILVKEGAQAFLALGAGPRGGDHLRRELMNRVVPCRIIKALQQFLAVGLGIRAALEQGMADGLNPFIQCFVSHHFVHQSQVPGGVRVHELGGKHVAPGLAVTHGPDHIGANGCRHQPQAHFTERNARRARLGTAISAQQISPSAPPKAAPWTRAMTGLVIWSREFALGWRAGGRHRGFPIRSWRRWRASIPGPRQPKKVLA